MNKPSGETLAEMRARKAEMLRDIKERRKLILNWQNRLTHKQAQLDELRQSYEELDLKIFERSGQVQIIPAPDSKRAKRERAHAEKTDANRLIDNMSRGELDATIEKLIKLKERLG